ncbi:rho guanine nucleotide exchange factor 10-like protein isoform X3 [Varroa jacobsoni]|uniref:rho guanine nucleotide exchange factor 10-like protein isoform X3 n=1 Tax=Varroa jacobsoni TaxID=62625 RepID=UPI000BF966BB|nr:rho guanine nucleotide exchange factor 10-like protein isoform X3 [Varroa jacobsoni]
MNSKVPYYYSELTPQERAERAERAAQQQHNGDVSNIQSADSNANQNGGNGTETGFFNPLLNIGTTAAYAKQLIFGSKANKNGSTAAAAAPPSGTGGGGGVGGMRHAESYTSRRNSSEPNIYEEIGSSCYSEYGLPQMLQQQQQQQPQANAGPQQGVCAEVSRVEESHAHILENLNLEVESMLMPPAEQAAHLKAAPASNGSAGLVNGSQATTPKEQRENNRDEVVKQHSMPVTGKLLTKQNALSNSSSSGADHVYQLYDDGHKDNDNIYEEVDIYQRQLGLGMAGGLGGLGLAGLAGLGQGVPEHSLTRWFSTRARKDSRRLASQQNLNNLQQPPGQESGCNGGAGGGVAGEGGGEYECDPLWTGSGPRGRKQRRPPLSLPPMPQGLSPEQVKRRLIVNTIVESENCYVSALHRLIVDFKQPLQRCSPPLLSAHKVDIMFHRVEQILQCHTIFGIALTQCVWEWDQKEMLGDVFLAAFSKNHVLEIYSDFVNNFTTAMDTARQASASKPQLAHFLKAPTSGLLHDASLAVHAGIPHQYRKMRQVYSSDRLGFYGLMVKPVQRFPQFILLLQDLLANTPSEHQDRLSLELALTQLECLAEALNERKRICEQNQAARELAKSLGSAKIGSKGVEQLLVRQDDASQLEMDSTGLVVKTKARRLLMLSDTLVCASGDGKNNVKWSVPIVEVEVLEDLSARSLLAGRAALATTPHFLMPHSDDAKQAAIDELADLVHDLEVMNRVCGLVATLKRPPSALPPVEALFQAARCIQEAIKAKEEEVAATDSACLQLCVPVKGSIFFQFCSSTTKRDWLTDLRLCKMWLDSDNQPAWETLPTALANEAQLVVNKHPLLSKVMPLFQATQATEVNCGCYYTALSKPNGEKSFQPPHYLWLCSTDGINSHMVILQQGLSGGHSMRPVGAFDLPESQITAMECAPPPREWCPAGQALEDVAETVWIATESKRLILLLASCPDKWTEVGNTLVTSPATQIKYFNANVYVALSNGQIYVYSRLSDGTGAWDLDHPIVVTLGADPVTSLLACARQEALLAACGPKIWRIDGHSQQVLDEHELHVHHGHSNQFHPDRERPEQGEHANLIAAAGTGLWVSTVNSSLLCLYHLETFKHLQDIDVSPPVVQMLKTPAASVFITSLQVSRGLLWAGTNVGVVVTLPLPKLEGIPLVPRGSVSASYHGHQGAVTFLISLGPSDHPSSGISGGLPGLPTSGMGVSQPAQTSNNGQTGDGESIYDLYADLMHLQEYEFYDESSERLNRSEPELIQLADPASRPRSWDMSSMDVSARGSEADDTETSQQSETPLHPAPAATPPAPAASNLISPLVNVAAKTYGTLRTLKKGKTKQRPPPNAETSGNIANTPPSVSGAKSRNQRRRTVLTLTGGCGYVNFKKGGALTGGGGDACVLVWETKVRQA